MNNNDDPWKSLVDATKSTSSEEQAETQPPSVSVKTLLESVQGLLLTLTWRRLSLFTAVLAGLILIVFYFFFRDDTSREEPIIPSEPPVAPAAP